VGSTPKTSITGGHFRRLPTSMQLFSSTKYSVVHCGFGGLCLHKCSRQHYTINLSLRCFYSSLVLPFQDRPSASVYRPAPRHTGFLYHRVDAHFGFHTQFPVSPLRLAPEPLSTASKIGRLVPSHLRRPDYFMRSVYFGFFNPEMTHKEAQKHR
jgi:hypothetical protein